MDHQSAVDRNLTERYLLAELESAESAEFEAHFFECSICAEDVRRAVTLVANLKAVFREEDDAIPAIELGPRHKFLDLTIALKSEASLVECEIHCQQAASPIVIAAPAAGSSLHLHLPADQLPAGPCTLILRDKSTRTELERRRFFISRISRPR
ncbi:MAG TPA: hypothetical protein VGR73_14910 [Bryobacteraceae bacterium]|nr:hypothetical protein [Bryobacteraceae bacterium]